MSDTVLDIVDVCNSYSNHVLNAYIIDNDTIAVVDVSGKKILLHVKPFDDDYMKLCMSYRHLWYGLKQEYTNVHIRQIKHIEKHRVMVYRFVLACFTLLKQSYLIYDIF